MKAVIVKGLFYGWWNLFLYFYMFFLCLFLTKFLYWKLVVVSDASSPSLHRNKRCDLVKNGNESHPHTMPQLFQEENIIVQ